MTHLNAYEKIPAKLRQKKAFKNCGAYVENLHERLFLLEALKVVEGFAGA